MELLTAVLPCTAQAGLCQPRHTPDVSQEHPDVRADTPMVKCAVPGCLPWLKLPPHTKSVLGQHHQCLSIGGSALTLLSDASHPFCPWSCLGSHSCLACHEALGMVHPAPATPRARKHDRLAPSAEIGANPKNHYLLIRMGSLLLWMTRGSHQDTCGKHECNPPLWTPELPGAGWPGKRAEAINTWGTGIYF